MSANSNTAQGIIRCARDLLIAGGYNGFSYADIADVVGIRKASIHHHFPTKAELVKSLLVIYREEADTGMAALARNHPEPVDQLSTYIGYWAACIGDSTATFCVCALLASQIPVLPAEIVSEVRSYFHALSAWLASALRKGAQDGSLVLNGTAEAEAELLMATVHGAMLSARTYGDASIFTAITHPLIERLRAR